MFDNGSAVQHLAHGAHGDRSSSLWGEAVRAGAFSLKALNERWVVAQVAELGL